MSYENLLSPIKIGTLTLRNRVVMGAMGSATANPDATVGECERAYYAERAKGGAGLIITEVTRVNHETAVMMPRQTSAAKDECIPGLKKLADDVHYYGGAIFCQLHHPG
ncbi:MAG: NADH:flavin oxidoreductase, partial [Oscillospiraceae bacterium]|nr:NADH:flavin oxidoreductase [Oscillospiraceae bacterium]